MNYNDVTICIPTLNEEDSIKTVVSQFKSKGFSNILVIDGDSSDNTRAYAKDAGATVKIQKSSGNKGSAMREVIDYINTSIIVFVDGDQTYNADDINRLVDPIIEDDYEHVIASRFGEMEQGSMSKLHVFGNKILNTIFTLLYQKNVYDLLTGYRAMKTDSFKDLELNSNGFDIETELTAKSILKNQNIKIIQSSYYKREGESELNSFSDGFKILTRMIKTRI